jgi:pimeloyl-ACP methyl ester carboxylesterase
MDHGLFQFQVEYFSQHYQLILWDVPKHGHSKPYDGFGLQQAAKELVQILNIEGIRVAHLVGQSMGGFISQWVARNHPDRVKSLTVVGSSPLQPSYWSRIDNWLLSIAPSLVRLYPYDNLVKSIARQIAKDQRSRAYALTTLQTHSKSEIVDIMAVVYQGVQAYGDEQVLPQPILITFGESDRTGKVQTYSRQWAQRENRQLKIIPEAAHNANMDNPKAFNRILDAFLRKIK